MDTIILPAETIRVVEECDICVIGGGCTGVFAAIRAARLGAKVVVVEKQNCFGGAATSALVNAWHSLYDTTRSRQIIAGLTWEVVERLRKRDAISTDMSKGQGAVFNAAELTIELDEMVREAGVGIHFHTLFSSALTEDGQVTAVVIQDKSGRRAIRARMYIDASGDADLCVAAGLETYTPDSVQPLTTFANFAEWDFGTVNPFELLRQYADDYELPEGFFFGAGVPPNKAILALNGTRIRDRNAAVAEELTEAEIEGRRQVRAILDIFRDHYNGQQPVLCGLPASIGIRETRHIHALYRLKDEDVLYGKHFDDAIANGTYPADVHHQEKGGITLKYLDGTQRYCRCGFGVDEVKGRWREETPDNPTFYQLPLRSFIPQSAKNVICAGRMIDAESQAFAASRVMVNLNQTGEAAGVAAYLALASGKDLGTVDPVQVRALLKNGGSCVLT